jgi:catechol 2,3-dioxygenase-like lactoylglutathione lyase family enzyme
MIKTINHITINVKDLDASIALYQDVLGFKKINTVDMGDHRLTYCEMPGGVRLELITYDKNKEISTIPTDGGIYRHIALEVDDIEEMQKKLEKAGIAILVPAFVAPQLNCQVLLVKDPNGVEIEFMQKN